MTESGVPVSGAAVEVDSSLACRALPIRRTRSSRGSRHRPGLFWSATTRGHVPYESWLELDRLWLADIDPQVCWIAAQPVALDGLDAGVRRCHVPDLLLSRRDAPPLLVDVKPAEFARNEAVAAVFDWTTRVAKILGWDFEVWTGADAAELDVVRALAIGRRYHSDFSPCLQASNPRALGVLASRWSTGWVSLNGAAAEFHMTRTAR
ncbi:TnsA-like heteromeric transposase endonuclease subunit [Corynebacterium variabile]|uniref:TnsA-like heteromeric transposase endonuclease subunit n=1 Tax=Corynebacterium variabile TaxID=1727 RepID=UPI002FDFF81B